MSGEIASSYDHHGKASLDYEGRPAIGVPMEIRVVIAVVVSAEALEVVFIEALGVGSHEAPDDGVVVAGAEVGEPRFRVEGLDMEELAIPVLLTRAIVPIAVSARPHVALQPFAPGVTPP